MEWLRWLDTVREGFGKNNRRLYNRPFLKVDILGRHVTGLMDSGATRSLMRSQKWEEFAKLGVELERADDVKLKLADGSPTVVLGKATLPVKVNEKVVLIEFLVIPYLNHDLYLGIDFWQKMRLKQNLEMGSAECCESVEDDKSGSPKQPILIAESSLNRDQRERLEKLIEMEKYPK